MNAKENINPKQSGNEACCSVGMFVIQALS